MGKKKIGKNEKVKYDHLEHYWEIIEKEDYPNTKTITNVLDTLEKEIEKLKTKI